MHRVCRGVWGHVPPENIWNFGHSEADYGGGGHLGTPITHDFV